MGEGASRKSTVALSMGCGQVIGVRLWDKGLGVEGTSTGAGGSPQAEGGEGRGYGLKQKME